MSHTQISVKLVQSNKAVFEKSKTDNVSYFNFREINHHANGKLIYVYPGGTIGGGHIGIVPKNKSKVVGIDPEVIDYRWEGDSVVMEIITKKGDIKNESIRKWLVLILLIVGSYFMVSKCMEPPTEDELIESQFSPVDGRHFNLQFYVEDNLKFPESFEHISTTHVVGDSSIIVTMRYKAQNLLKEEELFQITAMINKKDGSIIEIIN